MKNRFLKFASVAMAIFILSISALVTAAAYPKHTDYISDKAVILDEDTKSSIVKASNKLFEKKGVRIAVCTVLDTDGESIETFGSNIFKEWEIGDGVLILISKNDDNFYAVQSNSLSEYLSADELRHILNSSLEPSFVEKDYSKGVGDTVNALSNHLSNNVPADFGKEEKEGLPMWALVLIIIAAVIAAVSGGGFVLILYLRKKNARRRREEMELRRRRLAEGRGIDPRQAPRRPTQAPNNRPNQNTNGRPPQRPMQGNPQRPPYPPAGQNPPRRDGYGQSADRQSSNAATIQINTSDIRAAKQNKRQN
ncbi:MAG: TPM domain-containing protein [Clostridia bacterium]|nr:TPM domain-containing protein [Clostridia bacterium]